MCPRNNICERKDTLNSAMVRIDELIDFHVHMLLTVCLKTVKNMCTTRLLIINVKLSTDDRFNLKFKIVSRPHQ